MVPSKYEPEELFLHRPKANGNLSLEQMEQVIAVVRLLIGDEPQQTPIAERTYLAAIAAGDVYLLDVVLTEVAWALRSQRLIRNF
jgi:hypothetical protein